MTDWLLSKRSTDTAILACLPILFHPASHADIVTDGSVGPASVLAGPNFQIPESLGQRAGNNLFHSFRYFNIAAGEQAEFTGAASIANVISRVTGGQVSSINGLLRSSVGGSNFYLLNPSGVVFGPNAQVDVPASFFVSTADELRFPDGNRYSASAPNASVLSIEQPEAFGFLSNQTSVVTVTGSSIVLNSGETLAVSAAAVDIDAAHLAVAGGEVRIDTVAGETPSVQLYQPAETPQGGRLNLNNTLINTSGDGSGKIAITTGQGLVKNSLLFADNTGNADARPTQGLEINAETLTVDNAYLSADSLGANGHAADVSLTVSDRLRIENGARVTSTTYAGGDAGDVRISSRYLTVDGGSAGHQTSITSDVARNADGSAGNVTVQVEQELTLTRAGYIRSNTFAAGGAGNVTVTANNIDISGDETGIFSDANSGSTGAGGDISVTANDSLSLATGGLISSTTFGAGNSGNIFLTAHQMSIDEQGTGLLTGVLNDTESNASGDAGVIDIDINDRLTIVDGGIIRSNTFGLGKAGATAVTAGRLFIDGGNTFFGSGISSDSFRATGDAGSVIVNVTDDLQLVNNAFISSFTALSDGDGGRLEITADTLTLLDGGRILTDSFNAGDAGDIDVNARHILIDDRQSPFVTGISSASRGISGTLDRSSGQVGNITINAKLLELTNGAKISLESASTLTAAGLAAITPTLIDITADDVVLSDSAITTESSGNVQAASIKLQVANLLSLDPSSISTAARNADGGGITVRAKIVDLLNSQITTSVAGSGNGGDIDLIAEALVMDSGFIQANTGGSNFLGGNVSIATQVLLAESNNLQIGGNTPLSFQQGLNIIQAAAPDGVSGQVEVSTPQLDISGELTALEAVLRDIDHLAHNPCATPGGQQSSLSATGKGGLPATPEDPGTVQMNRPRLQRLLNTGAASQVTTPSPKSESGSFRPTEPCYSESL